MERVLKGSHSFTAHPAFIR